jgi:hypothetical protein
MGGFVAVVTIMILFYYSVVTGWTLKFFLAAATGQLAGQAPGEYWEAYSQTTAQPIFFHVVSVLIGAWIIRQGVVRGIERANKILIPALFVLLVAAAIRSVTLPGAERGPRVPLQSRPVGAHELPDLARGAHAVGLVHRRRLGAHPDLRHLHAEGPGHRAQLRHDRLRRQLGVAASPGSRSSRPPSPSSR